MPFLQSFFPQPQAAPLLISSQLDPWQGWRGTLQISALLSAHLSSPGPCPANPRCVHLLNSQLHRLNSDSQSGSAWLPLCHGLKMLSQQWVETTVVLTPFSLWCKKDPWSLSLVPGTQSLKHLEFPEWQDDRQVFCSNELTFGRSLTNYRMRATCRKTKPWFNAWNFQPHPTNLGNRDWANHHQPRISSITPMW